MIKRGGRDAVFLIVLALLVVGCSSLNYKVETDVIGRKHCRDLKTGYFVEMENCK